MTRFSRRNCTVLSLVLLSLCSIARADSPAPQQVASVEQLKSEAFKALRGGDFDKSHELLTQAARISDDPVLSQMADWTSRYEAQRVEFASARQKQYEEAVAKVQLLLDNGKDDYAIDEATRAYGLAENKDDFHNEVWVQTLMRKTAAIADQFEAQDQWLKALRVYSDLGSIEPANPQWKEKLKTATRRIRLLALYAPDELKAIQETEIKERAAVDALLNPATQPATQPVADAEEENNEFRIDWHESLRDVTWDMLLDALVHARTDYYRDISYKDLMIGGLNGLRALATTKGLEASFPTLADDDKRKAFLLAVDDGLEMAKFADENNEQERLEDALTRIRAVNKTGLNLPDAVLVSEYADGAFAQLDPFTSMIWPNDLEEFNRSTQGEFSGVGIQIETDDDGSLKVVSPLEDSPAYKAGIKAGDIITHINAKNAKGISLSQAVKNITGPSGSNVLLTVRGTDGEVKEYTIKRQTIKVDSVKGWLHLPGGGWDYFVDADQKIAYLRMTNFTKSTSKELDNAIHKMSELGARGLILDLRYNPGGLLTAATEVSDRFLQNGDIVSTRADRETSNPPTVARATPDDKEEIMMPTVVLVNQYSASASEIVSGALKDSKRAIIVGERTFGKGSVQMLFPLANRSAYLKLTTSHYYLPSGRCIHREENSQEWGVDPDIKVEMTPKQMEAAIDARQELDVLRDANAPPAEGEMPKLQDVAKGVEESVEKTAATSDRGLLDSDAQLSAALLLLRLQLAGAEI